LSKLDKILKSIIVIHVALSLICVIISRIISNITSVLIGGSWSSFEHSIIAQSWISFILFQTRICDSFKPLFKI